MLLWHHALKNIDRPHCMLVEESDKNIRNWSQIPKKSQCVSCDVSDQLIFNSQIVIGNCLEDCSDDCSDNCFDNCVDNCSDDCCDDCFDDCANDSLHH